MILLQMVLFPLITNKSQFIKDRLYVYNLFKMKTALKIGIIGTGNHGSRYARHIINDQPCFSLTIPDLKICLPQW